MTIKADLHNHFRTGSSFKDEDFDKVIDIAAERIGENGVLGLTNFNDSRYESFINLKGYDRQNLGNAVYIPEKKILIVKGQEIPAKEGHILALGIKENKHLKWGNSLEDTIKEAKDNNGIIVADHPFFKYGLGDYLKNNLNYLKDFDGIEVFNGECVGIPGLTPFKANKKSSEFLKVLRKQGYSIGGIATSDSHSFYEIGKNYSHLGVLDIKNSETIASSLRKEIKSSDNYHGKASLIGLASHIAGLGYYVAKSKLSL